MLLTCGADPFIADMNSETSLVSAIIKSGVEGVKILRNHYQMPQNSKILLRGEDTFDFDAIIGKHRVRSNET